MRTEVSQDNNPPQIFTAAPSGVGARTQWCICNLYCHGAQPETSMEWAGLLCAEYRLRGINPGSQPLFLHFPAF